MWLDYRSDDQKIVLHLQKYLHGFNNQGQECWLKLCHAFYFFLHNNYVHTRIQYIRECGWQTFKPLVVRLRVHAAGANK